eukprot:755719-Hanusia_phi.AAC.1
MTFYHARRIVLFVQVLFGSLNEVTSFTGHGCWIKLGLLAENNALRSSPLSMNECINRPWGMQQIKKCFPLQMNNDEYQARRNEIKFDAAASYRKAFPLGVNNVLDQVRESVNLALDDGLFRLRIQLNIHQFDQRVGSFAESKMPELVAMIGEIFVQRGMRPSFMFNTIMDASIAKSILPDHLRDKVSINVLGLGEFGEEYDAAVLVAPSNEGNENLQRIEAVEKLIYSGPPRGIVSRSARAKYMQRPIILINPVLEAIHSLSTPHSKVPPMFMSDFDVVYFLQLQAAMLRVRIANAGRIHHNGRCGLKQMMARSEVSVKEGHGGGETKLPVVTGCSSVGGLKGLPTSTMATLG